MALLPDPALLLLDEPTTGMDVEGRRAFWAAIRADPARGPGVTLRTAGTTSPDNCFAGVTCERHAPSSAIQWKTA